MEYTSTLHLKKPEYTDPVDVQDFNDNADIVDGLNARVENLISEIEENPDYAPTAEVVAMRTSLVKDTTYDLAGDRLDEIEQDFKDFVDDYIDDVEFDESGSLLYLIDKQGRQIGNGTTIIAGIAGLSMEVETDENEIAYLVLYDNNGEELCRTVLPAGGGGGGGASSYECRLVNTSGASSFSLALGQSLELSYTYAENYGGESTGADATATYFVKNGAGEFVQYGNSVNIHQGSNSIDCSSALVSGANTIRIQVVGGESGISKTLNISVNVVELTLTSTFSDSATYTGTISFLYRVTGKNLSKTMYFYVDGTLYESVDIGTAHNSQITQAIDLSSYGHGSHLLRCFFETDDGAKSPELLYDVIYDTGSSDPILSCTFHQSTVTYGETITVDYTVFTHGQDYTDEVTLGIYTLDANEDKVYFSQNTLSNIVNNVVQHWSITTYPASGTMYLELAAGEDVKTYEVEIGAISGDRDLSDVTTRLIANFSTSGRSNNDSGRGVMTTNYTSKDNVTTPITGTLTGFNYKTNGWVTDAGGYPVLRLSGDAEVNFNLPFFATSWTDANSHTIAFTGSPTVSGRTFEVAFKTASVTDESKEIISIWDDSLNLGIKIFPSRAYLLSNNMSIVTDADGNIINNNNIPHVPFSSTADKVRLSFVIEQNGYYIESGENNKAKQLIRIYVNGQLAKALAYENDSFSSNAARPHLCADSCILDVYTMRFYERALDDAEVLKNYIADLPSISEKITVYDQNDIVVDDDIDFALSAKQYPCMVLTGTLSAYKGDKVKVGIQLYKPDGTVEDGFAIVEGWDLMEIDPETGKYVNVNNVQGTSSQYYLKKNYKLTFYRWSEKKGKFAKVKLPIFDDRIPVSTICIKADYMSPDSANTGNSNFWQQILTEPTPPQTEDARIQTSVMGYPILLFQRDTASDPRVFIGRYNLNNDKSNANAFGLENDCDTDASDSFWDGVDVSDVLDDGSVAAVTYDADGQVATKCQKWEYKDNSESICNFGTDNLMALRTPESGDAFPTWEAALESCYPDQGDLEDVGLAPNLDYIQMLYTWVCQRANFLAASTSTGGGTYNGTTYTNDYDLKRAIFRAEFTKHFNLPHTLHYFIANEFPLLVDNLAKNMFLTSYDVTAESLVDPNGDPVTVASLRSSDGSMNVNGVDWVNSDFAIWYPTLYDLDSCLGADNNGFDKFPYYKEMWDSFNGGDIVNGANSVFWRLFYNAFYNEIKGMVHTLADTNNDLTVAKYTKAMVDDLTSALPIVSINKDEKFKYIDAYEGGYWDGSANNGEGAWVYDPSFLYLVKSTMESYHKDFIQKRFAMLYSKYLTDTYLQDYVTFRINRNPWFTPEDPFTYADTAPSDPSEGDYWYDSANEALKIYDNGAWTASVQTITVGETSPVAPTDGDWWYDTVNDALNEYKASTPNELAFNVAPCQALYCYTEWGNSGSYIGGKCLEGNTYQMKPAAAGNWYDIVVKICGASRLKSLGDLSGLIPSKPISLSRCVNLTELKLGDGATGYVNPKLDGIAGIDSLTMLQKLDVRNCTALSGTINLANCDLIKEVYANGSALASIVLPEGGYLETLKLPASTASINVVDHAGLTTFTCDSYNNLTYLRVHNTPNIPTDQILLARGANLSRIRLEGVNWTLEDDTLLHLLCSSDMQGKALNASGAEIDDATAYPYISGTVTVPSIYDGLLTPLATLYPDLTVNYSGLSHMVTFTSYDDTVVYKESVPHGTTAKNPITYGYITEDAVAKPADVHYYYDFYTWDKPLNNITADLTVKATYHPRARMYNVSWVNGQDTTVESIEYGTTISDPLTNEDCPYDDGYEYIWGGWRFDTFNDDDELIDTCDVYSTTVGGRTTATALWYKVAVPSQVKAFSECDWGEIKAVCDAARAGTLTNNNGVPCDISFWWDVHEEKEIKLSTRERVIIKIAGFWLQVDENGDPIPVHLIMKHGLATARQMNYAAKYQYGYTVNGEEVQKAAGYTYSYSYDAENPQVEIEFTEYTFLTNVVRTIGETATTWGFSGARNSSAPATRLATQFSYEDCNLARTDGAKFTGTVVWNMNDDSASAITVDATGGSVRFYDTSMSTADGNYRTLEFAPGSKLIIPMTDSGTVKINARSMWNAGGYFNSDLYNDIEVGGKSRYTNDPCANAPLVEQFPPIIQKILTPFRLTSNLGGLTKEAVETKLVRMAPPLANELQNSNSHFNQGAYTLERAYSNPVSGDRTTAGTGRWPCYTTDASRIITRGINGSASYTWAASASRYYTNLFAGIHTSGNVYSSYGAGNAYTVFVGFGI